MRVFWVLIGLVAIAAVSAIGYTFMQQRRAIDSLAEATAAQVKAAEQEAQLAAEVAATAAENESLRNLPPEPTKPQPSSSPVTTEAPVAEVVPPAHAPPTTPAATNPTAEAPPPPGEVAPTPPAPANPGGIAPDVHAPAGPIAEPAKIGEYDVAPGTVERKADGTLLIDGKYVVKGAGTPEDPYQVSWEQLTSAADSFDPQSGKKKIPQRIAMLHDKHVRISGYISFPLMVEEPRECLAMLNQWDGCCIGVPPTPYDALEVTLAKPATGNNRYAIAGNVTGVFQVKPYVMGNWLVGLYMLNRSKLEGTDFGGPAGN
ncbi:MAG: DUF3299 domain-containing protein [Leptolyngbya sp. PLA1]|nr:DUF3299 domain-containing protein [Leptolyngbya sp. PLA1]